MLVLEDAMVFANGGIRRSSIAFARASQRQRGQMIYFTNMTWSPFKLAIFEEDSLKSVV
jgi:hypothetical protein